MEIITYTRPCVYSNDRIIPLRSSILNDLWTQFEKIAHELNVCTASVQKVQIHITELSDTVDYIHCKMTVRKNMVITGHVDQAGNWNFYK